MAECTHRICLIMLWSSLWMACMQRFVLFIRACKAGVITPLLFIVVPRYLNSSKASYDLKFVLFYGGLPLWRRTCKVLVFLALIVIPISFAICAISVRVLSRREAGARKAMSSAYAASFSFPSLPSSQIRRGPRHRLKIHGEMRLPRSVPLLVLNLFSPMLT